MFEMDINQAYSLIVGLHIVSKCPTGSEYVYRRFSATGGDSGGLPIINIYRKK